MAAYVTVNSNVKDQDKLAQYKEQAIETVTSFGGEVLAKGEIQKLNGKANFTNKLILKFPCQKSALSWYQSAEYQALIDIRDEAMESQFDLI